MIRVGFGVYHSRTRDIMALWVMIQASIWALGTHLAGGPQIAVKPLSLYVAAASWNLSKPAQLFLFYVAFRA